MNNIANNKIQANSLADNKIQAKKPEVGDVMLHKASNRKAIINYSSMMKDENTMAYMLFDGIRTFALEEYVVKENYTYLGKSKVSIEELFDVAED